MVLSQTVRELCSQSRFGDGSTREELNGCQVRLNSPIGLYIYIFFSGFCNGIYVSAHDRHSSQTRQSIPNVSVETQSTSREQQSYGLIRGIPFKNLNGQTGQIR